MDIVPTDCRTGVIIVADDTATTLAATVGDATTGGSDTGRVEVATPTTGEDEIPPVDGSIVTEWTRADATDEGLVPLHPAKAEGNGNLVDAPLLTETGSLGRKTGALTLSMWGSPALEESAPKLSWFSSVSTPDTFSPSLRTLARIRSSSAFSSSLSNWYSSCCPRSLLTTSSYLLNSSLNVHNSPWASSSCPRTAMKSTPPQPALSPRNRSNSSTTLCSRASHFSRSAP